MSRAHEGIYFAYDDCAGLWRRCLILAIDLGVLWVVWMVAAVTCLLLVLDHQKALGTAQLAWLAFGFFYLTVLKASSFGTLGYLLARVRIVSLQGERPSLSRMMFRLLLSFFGPFNVLFDLIWMCGDDCRQSLRDKLAGTYLARRRALPAGRGKVRLMQLFFLAMSVPYRMVQPAHEDRESKASDPPLETPRPG